MAISRASSWYRERSGLTATRRGPLPACAPGLNPAAAYPVAPPLPLPAYLAGTQGDPPPDRGVSTVWPHGTDGEAPQ